MVGDGYMKDGLMSRCNDQGVGNNVKFVGSMKGQPLIDLFKATDVVCIPSRNEPFGIVTLEAWAAKKPVVVTKNGGPREFVWHDNDGEGESNVAPRKEAPRNFSPTEPTFWFVGYVVDANADGIAWGVGSIFANFDHGRYMGEKGRVKAAFQFSWDRIAEVTNDVYDELYGIYPPAPGEEPAPEEETVGVESDESETQDLSSILGKDRLEHNLPVVSHRQVGA